MCSIIGLNWGPRQLMKFTFFFFGACILMSAYHILQSRRTGLKLSGYLPLLKSLHVTDSSGWGEPSTYSVMMIFQKIWKRVINSGRRPFLKRILKGCKSQAWPQRVSIDEQRCRSYQMTKSWKKMEEVPRHRLPLTMEKFLWPNCMTTNLYWWCLVFMKDSQKTPARDETRNWNDM